MAEELIHGGALEKIAKQYNRPIDEWLDLSTGISPFSYPIPKIPTRIWQRLPEQNDAFVQAANQYYKTENWLACSGSQSAIQILPKLWLRQVAKVCDVWVPREGYKEHEKAWRNCNQQNIIQYDDLPCLNHLSQNCVIVVINPNNPSGQIYSTKTLVELSQKLKSVNGLLIIDEAFIDSEEKESVFKELSIFSNVIVLRSMGKFFGLAGIRVGFILSSQPWLQDLKNELGIWSLTGASLYIAEQALNDTEWHKKQKSKLIVQSSCLENLLQKYFGQITGTYLFKTVKTAEAITIHKQLCEHGILVRLCDEKNALRFGIPNKQGYLQLVKVLCQTMDMVQP